MRIITAPGNLGYAGGVNVCLRAAPDADGWWVLNPDTRPDPAALGELVARLGRGDCAAVGSTIYFADGKVQGRGGQFRPWLARAVGLDFGKALDDPPSADLEARLWYLSGASMMAPFRSNPRYAWRLCWATMSHCVAEDDARVMSTTQALFC